MKKTLLTILSLVLCTLLHAGDITVIDWSVLRIDSVEVPIYSETVPLAADYKQYEFSVQIEYPEWEPLSRREAAMMACHEVSSSLQVDTHVGTMNHKGYLDINFVPVVRDGAGYKKLVSCRITVLAHRLPTQAPAASRAGDASRYASSSVLATGRWVKIAVDKEGVYRLTRQQLASMGFGDPSQVRVYGYGGQLLSEALKPELFYDDLPEVPVITATDGSLLFWADGVTGWKYTTKPTTTSNHTTNYCSTRGYYFVTDGAPTPLPHEASVTTTPRQTLTSCTNKVLLDVDDYAWASLGRRLFDSNSTLSSTLTYTLSTPGAVAGSTATVQVCISGNRDGSLTPYINSEAKTAITFGVLAEYDKALVRTTNYTIPASSPTTQVQFRPSGFDARLDYIEVHYERELECQDAIMFRPTASGVTAFQFKGWSGEMQLLRLPEPTLAAARIMPTADNRFVVSNAQHRYVAINTAATSFPSPTVIGGIENQNLHNMVGEVDMVIITPVSGLFDGEAQRLADAHAATDGLRCVVVRADRIYNEFSSGTPDVSAYRMYMKMLYDRQSTAPRYLLLFGDCAADNRMLSRSWKGCDINNFLLCFESDNSYSDTQAYVCEDYLGMLDDGEGALPTSDKADVSVGRFTVRNKQEAKAVVDKTIAHLTAEGGAWNNRIVVMGDDGDNNSHMDYANKVADTINVAAPDMEVIRIMWDAYKRESSALTNTFPGVASYINRLNNDGVLVFNYTGHGATYVLSHENVMTLDEMKKWKNKHLPLWFTAACDIMPIDGTAPNIGEQMVLNANGGAVAFVGTTRTVYAAQNYTLNKYFSALLMESDATGRRYSVGDALRLAKNGGVSNTPNKLHYVLVGDPSLVFGNPATKVVLDSINGEEVNMQQLKAGSRATMVGHIVDRDGRAINDFNGILSTHVYDSEVLIKCNNAAKVDSGAFIYRDRNKVLYEGRDSVKAGRFKFTFVVPIDINYSGEAGRVNFYASSARLEANGHCDDFMVGGRSDELAYDKEGPEMFITLGDDEFVDGGVTNSTPCFMASLHDENGISTTSCGIGHNLELNVDGKASMTYDLSSYYVPDFGTYGKGQVVFPMPEMEPGEHKLSFRAWDLLNNPATRTLSFVVDKNFTPNISRVFIVPNPAKTFTNIYVTHNCTGSRMDVEIGVYDYTGKLVHNFITTGDDATRTVCVTWDLTSGNKRVGPGIYLVRSRICRDGVWSDGETQKLFILRQ